MSFVHALGSAEKSPERTFARATLDSIRNTTLVSSTGKTATIGSLAQLIEIPGQTEIRRENLQRLVQVTARFENLNLGDGMAKVQQAVQELNLPPGIRVQYGGQFEEQQKSFKDLAFVLVLAIVLVFTVLLFEFGGFAAPVAIIASALLSTCGVFLALLISGITFNLSSFMGLIMVIGIVAKNGILLLDANEKFRSNGLEPEDAIVQAGRRRLRPIVMTSLSFILGVLPLIISRGAGAEMRRTLGTAVFSGMVGVTLFGIVLTPVFFFTIDWLGESRWFHTRLMHRLNGIALDVIALRSMRRATSGKLRPSSCRKIMTSR